MKYKIEAAKSSRATCKNKTCKKLIEKGELKLLIASYNGFAPSGIVYKDYCTACGHKMLLEEKQKLEKSIQKLEGVAVKDTERKTVSSIKLSEINNDVIET